MAKSVTAIQLGGQPKVLNDMDTVQDILDHFDLTGVSIKINGQAVEPDHELSDYDFVSFGEKVKGGLTPRL
jgi:sulfur carrier protein ThiS